jgi:diacylglycerol kinase (ATP)
MNNSKKWVFIVNPISGNNFGSTVVPKLKEKIEQYKIDAEIVMTERHGHATEIAEEYHKKGFYYFIAVGGDGTIHEVGGACVGKKDFVFGVVPAGTGNDFNQNLGFPDRFEEEHWEVFFQFRSPNSSYCHCRQPV